MLTMVCATPYAEAKSNGSFSLDANTPKLAVPQEASDFVKDNYYSMLMATKNDYSLGNISEKDCILGEPFIIANVDKKEVEKVYYYPIIIGNKVRLVLATISTSEGWSLSLSEEYVESLNSIDYVNATCGVMSISGNKIVPVKENMVEKANETLLDMKTIDIHNISETSIKRSELVESYTPSYSFDVTTGSDMGRIFSLYNRKGQGTLPICWAASVATIVNYRKGSNLSAKEVCDAMGTKYTGQNIDMKLKALHYYGLTAYKKQSSCLKWKTIIKNVDNKRPVAMSTFNNNSSGHAVTLIGYRFRNGTKYVVFWNSGNQEIQTVTYSSGGNVTYTYNGEAWVWTKSLSRYVDE